MRVLKLGTRRSLLAWAQSGWVAREIERLNPGVRVELVGIDTRGDKIQDVSLQSIEGKEFFVAELDQALRSGTVDLTVHSMKDLSLERPEAFVLAAVPTRENPRDVVLFGPGTLEKIRSGQAIRIGTSSPRRLENIPPFLTRALPQVAPGGAPKVEFVEIRGNVNTRLSRVLESVTSPKFLDGVVLAFAGLIRLWQDEAGRKELQRLLRDLRWMVLPLAECPAASAQGALAVECRRDDSEVRSFIRKLHHEETEEAAKLERSLLAEWGGGCHQRFGATAIHHSVLGRLLFVRGYKPNGTYVEEFSWNSPKPAKRGTVRPWNGKSFRANESSLPTGKGLPELTGRSVFLGHSRALPEGQSLQGARVWTSGTASWFKLAEKGVWVEGCAESLGFDHLLETLNEPVLGLGEPRDWVVLTHTSAAQEWSGKEVITTYETAQEYSEEAKQALKAASHIFWSSGSQFDALGSLAPQGAHHACGPGRTSTYLVQKGLNPEIFPSAEEWTQWLSKG